jgi:hypothetical protein
MDEKLMLYNRWKLIWMMKNWKNEMMDSSIVKFQKKYGFSNSLYILLVEIL